MGTKWEQEPESGQRIGTKWEQEPRSGKRMGTQWEQEPKSEWKQSGNKKPKSAT